MERVKTVMEILDKMNFFQGQRAGRELWNDKPFEVQEEDLENFKRDINTIGSYIWKIVKELKQYRDAEEQGLLLRLPCKAGDAVYSCECGMIVRDFVHSFSTDVNGLWAINLYGGIIGLFGLSVFTTQEEAEQALAKVKEV